jgi:transcriptional regulator with XRE-family HTH domain
MNSKIILGKNIKKYRKKAGLTQEQLAEQLNVSSKHLSNIEIGSKFVTSALLDTLCTILNVNPATLFYSVESKPDDKGAKIDSIIDEQVDHFISMVKEKLKEEL